MCVPPALPNLANLFLIPWARASHLPFCLNGVQVIPAENLVAAFQASSSGLSGLLAVASDAASARVFLEALQVGECSS